MGEGLATWLFQGDSFHSPAWRWKRRDPHPPSHTQLELILVNLSFQQKRGSMSWKRGRGSGLGATYLPVLQRCSWLFGKFLHFFLLLSQFPRPEMVFFFFFFIIFTSFACLLGCGSKLFFVCSLFSHCRSHMEPSEKLWISEKLQINRNPMVIIRIVYVFPRGNSYWNHKVNNKS